jgi:hypothetical protein
MSFEAAKKCFVENTSLFGNAQVEPEKFNLYNGLSNMAEALKKLEQEVHQLRREVADLSRK